MATVPLQFALPAEEGIQSVKIYESTAPDGVWNLIDTITPAGSYPEYIHDYTTVNAASKDNWFSISYIDVNGDESDLSAPMQGGQDTLVNILTQRVMQRNQSLSESIVIQEAEAVIEAYFHQDPYAVELPVSYRVMSGLTYLIMARSMVSTSASTSASDSWTAGLVSMKSSTSQGTQTDVQYLLDMASMLLQMNYSVIAQMATVGLAGGLTQIESTDISRLIVEIDA